MTHAHFEIPNFGFKSPQSGLVVDNGAAEAISRVIYTGFVPAQKG